MPVGMMSFWRLPQKADASNYFSDWSQSPSKARRSTKGFDRGDEYYRLIERIHSHGIAVQVGLVFGFDHDPPQIFEQTIDVLENAGVQNATFNILTPFRAPACFKDWKRKAHPYLRLESYNSRQHVVYQPKQMGVAELLAGFRDANERFYSLPSIARRLSHSRVQLWWTLPLNLAYSYQWFTQPIPGQS